ncbi:glycosyltransferase family 2 protein [Anaerosporobacter sp.]|uniref:glycosyltransferase family 2 protein n=1 Tax=Anaerosporobacter sp. TaxID=1872529 RepID=UPI0028A077FB|nr:glycosyltransferase family 2 protein [Anaerosporobacter sp.]
MVEIIMAAYNGEKYIKQQIESIMKNTYENIHLTIYDDTKEAQTTATMTDILRLMTEKYGEKLTYKKNEQNKGCTRNFLEGLQASDAEYTMFSDQDDYWNKDKVERTLEKMKEMENKYGKDTPLVVFTDAIVVDSTLNLIHFSFHRSNHLNTKRVDLAHLLMENKLIGCTMMMNKALKNKIIAIPKNARVHDWWVALVAAAFGKIGYLEDSTILYRQHEDNVIGNQEYGSYIKKRLASLQSQREVIYSNMKQAEEFLEIYNMLLTKEQKSLIGRFANLNKRNWFYRRYTMYRYGYKKSGVPRNLGLLLVL